MNDDFSLKAKKALWEAADFNISDVYDAATKENASPADIIQSSSDTDIVMVETKVRRAFCYPCT